MSSYRIKHIRSLNELDRIESIWRELERAHGRLSVFQSWVWNRTWCEHFLSRNDACRLDVRLLEDKGGSVLAIFPFFSRAVAGPVAEVLQFLGHRMFYQNDVLLSGPENPELTAAAVNMLIEDLGYRTIMHLRHLDEESAFTRELVRRGIAEPQCTRLRIKVDTSITDQTMRFGRSTRKRFKGQFNKLKREFGIEFHVMSGDDFMPAVEELVELHHHRFASQKRSTRFQGENLAFRIEVMNKMKQDDIFEIVRLCAAGKTIASALMARDKGNYYCIQTGFDPEFARFSPMRLLLTESIRHGFEELGCQSYDLGPGYEQYKFDWNPSVGTNFFCCVGGRGPYAKTMASLYRYAFRRSLPVPAPPASKD